MYPDNAGFFDHHEIELFGSGDRLAKGLSWRFPKCIEPGAGLDGELHPAIQHQIAQRGKTLAVHLTVFGDAALIFFQRDQHASRHGRDEPGIGLAFYFLHIADEVGGTDHSAHMPAGSIADQLRCGEGFAPGEVREIDGHFAQRGAVIGVAERDISCVVKESNIVVAAILTQVAEPGSVGDLSRRVMRIVGHHKGCSRLDIGGRKPETVFGIQWQRIMRDLRMIGAPIGRYRIARLGHRRDLHLLERTTASERQQAKDWLHTGYR